MVVVVRLRASAERRSVLGGVLWRFCVSRDVTDVQKEEKRKTNTPQKEKKKKILWVKEAMTTGKIIVGAADSRVPNTSCQLS